MDTELNGRVLAAVQGSGISDNDQRSALGMARSWLANGKEIRPQTYFVGHFKMRDDLAKALVEEMRGTERGDCAIALAEAREWVNAPFINPDMNGQKFGRRELTKPGAAVEESDD